MAAAVAAPRVEEGTGLSQAEYQAMGVVRWVAAGEAAAKAAAVAKVVVALQGVEAVAF